MKDKKYKIDYSKCMLRKCDCCRYKINCFKEEGELNDMVEIEVIKPDGYDDKQLGVHKNKGDKYIVSKNRSIEILKTGWAIKVRDVVEEIEVAKKKVKAETAIKKTRKKTK